MACSCQRLQSKPLCAISRRNTARILGGSNSSRVQRITVRGLPILNSGESTEVQATQDNVAARIILQASLFAVAIAVPFTAPDSAWARKQPAKEEPVVTVVEDTEPEFVQKARELAKQAQEQATKALQTARTTSEAAVEYVKEQSVVVTGKAQVLKQQLVATYGTPAALEKTEVKAAGAVVALVVLVVLFKAISSVFSSPSAEPAKVESNDDATLTPTPSSLETPAAASPEQPAVETPVLAPVAAATTSVPAADVPQVTLDVESATAMAAELRDLYQNNPQQFAVMAQWLQSPAAEQIRPRLLDELQRLTALATSSQDEDDSPPPSGPPAAAAPQNNASSNGVVKTSKTKAEKEVDARQLITMVEWLRSPGAAPVRDQLGADVADQVAVWASRRVGLPETPAAPEEPTSSAATEQAVDTSAATPQPTSVGSEQSDARKWIDNWAAKQTASATESQSDARQWIDNWAAKQQNAASTEAPTHTAEPTPAPVTEASAAATPADAPTSPAAPGSLGEVIKQKGAATPALIALGLGALALDLVLGKSPTKKSRKGTDTAGADSKQAVVTEEVKADATAGAVKPAVVVQPLTAQPVVEAVASKPQTVELEAVTFSFDEGATKAR